MFILVGEYKGDYDGFYQGYREPIIVSSSKAALKIYQRTIPKDQYEEFEIEEIEELKAHEIAEEK
jgi:hypothetical protein